MKKLIYLVVVIGALALIVAGCGLLTVPPAEQSETENKGPNGCTTIQNGTLTYSAGHYLEGHPLMVGYDPYGYNYQAHMFKGSYANAYLGRPGTALPPYEGDDETYLIENPEAASHWTWPYRDVQLIMKWSDVWISNKDCNADGKLDRGYACDPSNADSSACEGAWLTNHQSGEYEGDEGEVCKWNYFVKIVAAPSDAYVDSGFWYTYDDIVIGPVIWTSFAIIQQVENDACAGLHGAQYISPYSTGFEEYGPE